MAEQQKMTQEEIEHYLSLYPEMVKQAEADGDNLEHVAEIIRDFG